MLFGRYTFDQQWRPGIVNLLFIGLYVVSAMRRFWRKELLIVWVVTLVLIAVLMWGGVAGLSYVPQDQWGGLPLTLILATFGLCLGFPLAVAVALGRRSKQLPAVKALCVLYVELIRGVPLVTLLFMASVMFPLFLPDGFNIDKLLRAQVAIILFARRLHLRSDPRRAAGFAQGPVRGGRRPRPVLLEEDRVHRAAAGRCGWSSHRWSNTFIGFFKDTSLVLIIGLFRPAGGRQERDQRADLGCLLDRDVPHPRRDLLRVLLHPWPAIRAVWSTNSPAPVTASREEPPP